MVQKSGTRLSGGVKKSIKAAKKSGTLNASQAQALRKQLRTPGTITRETKLVSKAMNGGRPAAKNVYTAQAKRSTTRAAGKLRGK
jgi:phage host-nuclease inhibitor protein Gam